jgi:hypothetical protein
MPASLGVACLVCVQLRRTLKKGTHLQDSPEAQQ